MERAIDWVFSHASELDSTPMETESPAASQPQYRDMDQQVRERDGVGGGGGGGGLMKGREKEGGRERERNRFPDKQIIDCVLNTDMNE